MFFVYRFLDIDENVIYVGKSKQELRTRFKGHKHLPDECYKLVRKIEYIECETESDMSIKEIYYINKYRDNDVFFNLLDKSVVPQSVDFDDVWILYEGELDSQFLNSINYLENYRTPSKSRYKIDGSVKQTKSNKQKGKSSFVEGFTPDEVNKIAHSLMQNILQSENANQEQIRFRNLVMFILGVNLPVKLNDLLRLQYKDLFDEKDQIRNYEMQLSRIYHDEQISIPLPQIVQQVLLGYVERYGLNYENNHDDFWFLSRKHQVITSAACNYILSDGANSAGIIKNIGGESLRKTYGLHIYNSAENKLEAIMFLEYLWGQSRYGQLIDYLGLLSEEIDFAKFFNDKYALCTLDQNTFKQILTGKKKTY